jgi:hypothetical protein
MSSEELYFGGAVIPPPEVFAQAEAGNPTWYKVFSAAYDQLAARPDNEGKYARRDGKGATIAQTARLFELVGIVPYFILTRRLPDAHVAALERLERRSPRELTRLLARLRQAEGQLGGITALYHDGATGHCIRLTDYLPDEDRFVYHDPWPARSLLCEENNKAGVKAEPRGSRWSVTREELERVLVGVFMFAAHWLRANEQLEDLKFTSLLDTEFFKFFHLKLIDERVEAPGVRRAFAPGPFGASVQVQVLTNASVRVLRAVCTVERDWLLKNFAMALDISNSFIGAFAPNVESETQFRELASTLRQLRDPKQASALQQSNPADSPVIACLHAFVGSAGAAHLSSDLARLDVCHEARESSNWLVLSYKLY